MSDPAATIVETPAPDLPMGREYMRLMNEADAAGKTLESTTEGAIVVEPTPELSTEAEPEPVKADTERDSAGKFKKGNPRHDPNARVAEATAESARLKSELAAAVARAEAAERRVQEPAQRGAEADRPEQVRLAGIQSAAPKLEDFLDQPDPYASLSTATARYEVARILSAERAAQEVAKITDANTARFTKAMADDPELPGLMAAADDAMIKAGADPRAPVPAVICEAIRRSEQGPDIVRYLGSHPEELVSIANAVKHSSDDTVVRLMLEAKIVSTLAPTAAVSTGSAAALPRPSAVPLNPVRTSREPAPAADPSEQPFGRKYVQEMNARERKGA